MKQRTIRRPTERAALDNLDLEGYGDPFAELRASEKRARAERRDRVRRAKVERAHTDRADRRDRAKRAEKHNRTRRADRARERSITRAIRTLDGIERCAARAIELAQKSLTMARGKERRNMIRAARRWAQRAWEALENVSALERVENVSVVPTRVRSAVARAIRSALRAFAAYNAPLRAERRAQIDALIERAARDQAERDQAERDRREAQIKRSLSQPPARGALIGGVHHEVVENAVSRTRDGRVWLIKRVGKSDQAVAAFTPRGKVAWVGRAPMARPTALISERNGITLASGDAKRSKWMFEPTHARGGVASSGVGIWVAGQARPVIGTAKRRGEWRPCVTLVTPSGAFKRAWLPAPIAQAEPDGSGGVYVFLQNKRTYHVALARDGASVIFAYPLS